MERRAVDIY